MEKFGHALPNLSPVQRLMALLERADSMSAVLIPTYHGVVSVNVGELLDSLQGDEWRHDRLRCRAVEKNSGRRCRRPQHDMQRPDWWGLRSPSLDIASDQRYMHVSDPLDATPEMIYVSWMENPDDLQH